MTSRERALQCAASLPPYMLFYHFPDERREAFRKRYKMTDRTARRVLTKGFMDQLDACRSEEARRLLLGIGEPFEGTREAAR